MDDHVAVGSRGLASQYISTSATYNAIRDLLDYKTRGDCDNIQIVKINLDVLTYTNRVTDLTDQTIQNSLTSMSAILYADRYDEVLIEGTIPGNAFEVIYSGEKSKCPYQEP